MIRRKLLPGLLLSLSAAILPPLCSSAHADIIYLKNGKQIPCDSAWEEGKEVKYAVANGTVGIPKSMVAKVVKETPQTRPVQTAPSTLDASSQQAIQTLKGRSASSSATSSQDTGRYTKMGIQLAEQKDLAGALENFQKAYEANKNEETALNLALTYFALMDDWNARLYFNEVLKFSPKSTVSLNYLGEISWRSEDLQDASDYWQESLGLKEDPLIRQKLSRLKKEKNASADYEHNTSRHFLIRYDGGNADPGLVQEISDFLEEKCRDLSAQFDYYPTAPFVVVLYPAREYFNVTDAPLWSGGANDGKIKLPVKGINSLTRELRQVLTHELTHSFVDLKTSNNCPVWLQEGLAQYTEGQRADEDGIKLISALIERNQIPSIANLSGSFAGTNSKVAAVLYLESLAFTEYLINKYQFYLMNDLLEELGNGESPVTAFENAYSIPLSQADAGWRNSLTQ